LIPENTKVRESLDSKATDLCTDPKNSPVPNQNQRPQISQVKPLKIRRGLA
jgi:hypothetical protein